VAGFFNGIQAIHPFLPPSVDGDEISNDKQYSQLWTRCKTAVALHNSIFA